MLWKICKWSCVCAHMCSEALIFRWYYFRLPLCLIMRYSLRKSKNQFSWPLSFIYMTVGHMTLNGHPHDDVQYLPPECKESLANLASGHHALLFNITATMLFHCWLNYTRNWLCMISRMSFLLPVLFCLVWKSPWLGGWVDHRASLAAVEKRKISCPSWESNPNSNLYSDWDITVHLYRFIPSLNFLTTGLCSVSFDFYSSCHHFQAVQPA
jgi:hypothetical protein